MITNMKISWKLLIWIFFDKKIFDTWKIPTEKESSSKDYQLQYISTTTKIRVLVQITHGIMYLHIISDNKSKGVLLKIKKVILFTSCNQITDIIIFSKICHVQLNHPHKKKNFCGSVKQTTSKHWYMNLYLTQEHPVDEYLYILKTELQVNFFKYSNFALIQFHSNLKKSTRRCLHNTKNIPL